MAERRMFAKTIIDSDLFLDMPASTQLLYFHLAMRADDDGFINNPKKIQRMVGCNDDDIRILISKQFILPFESGIIVIKHWRIHNYIRNDRYKPTMCEEKKLITLDKNMVYQMTPECQPVGIPAVNQMETQDRLGQDRLGEVRTDKDSSGKVKKSKSDKSDPDPVPSEISEIVDLYHEVCVSLPKVVVISDKRKKAIKLLTAKFTQEQIKTVFETAEKSDFLKGIGRDWRASLDWLIKPDNFVKVLEGNYNNAKKSGNSKRSDGFNAEDYECLINAFDDLGE